MSSKTFFLLAFLLATLTVQMTPAAPFDLPPVGGLPPTGELPVSVPDTHQHAGGAGYNPALEHLPNEQHQTGK
uniref:Putative conserved secreted protein n=1 Tax=Culex tarsalis TaxID=7177 RepID=A0A1Q3EV79_CULTA